MHGTTTLEILRPYSDKLHGVFHCFGGSLEQANEVVDLGHLVSFTGIVTFKNGAACVTSRRNYRSQFMSKQMPYLAPVPLPGKTLRTGAYAHRGRDDCGRTRNSLQAVAEMTTQTAEEFFRFKRELEGGGRSANASAARTDVRSGAEGAYFWHRARDYRSTSGLLVMQSLIHAPRPTRNTALSSVRVNKSWPCSIKVI